MGISRGLALLALALVLISCGSSTAPTASRGHVTPAARPRGAVFDFEIGENITNESYRTVRRRFGPPVKTFAGPGNVHCVYYDVVGEATGWVFCFRGQKMVSADGNQTAPKNVH
jgi:hypothetical protein